MPENSISSFAELAMPSLRHAPEPRMLGREWRTSSKLNKGAYSYSETSWTDFSEREDTTTHGREQLGCRPAVAFTKNLKKRV